MVDVVIISVFLNVAKGRDIYEQFTSCKDGSFGAGYVGPVMAVVRCSRPHE